MRVLIHSNREELDRNIEPVNYSELPALKKRWGGNLGNKLFLTAMDVYCHMDGVSYKYLTDDMTPDYINSNFDIILWPLANGFCASKEIMGYLEEYTIKISKYKVPILALGAGAQAKSYDDLDILVDAIKDTASKFIDAVHATGGVFGLRGYFTMELFNKLGYKDDYVTGCPSMYQMGRGITIKKKTISEADIRLALNGDNNSMKLYSRCKLYEKYPQSWFVDQGDFVLLMYDKKEEMSVKRIRKLMSTYSKMGIQMLSDGRIVCIYDLPRLAQQLCDLNINFSFGQRIHGNILATLLGIPAVVYTHDSRTKELADFFEIPTYSDGLENTDLLSIYNESDWSNFNNNFARKYDAFEKLLVEYGMPRISESKYDFMSDVERYKLPNEVNDYSEIREMNKLFWFGIK